MLTHAQLLDTLHYDPETGVFTCLVRRGKAKAGKVAGNLSPAGYVRIMVLGTSFPAHRLAWFYVTGTWPIDHIDHINGIRNDNRLSNLRQATHRENLRNSSTYTTNTTGVKGLSQHISGGWQAYVGYNYNRRTKYFTHNQKEAAIEWLRTTRSELHGDFANHGTQ